MKKSRCLLYAGRLCETQGGNLAYAIGRVAFKPGRPMLIEHIDGSYLEHDLFGRVITPGAQPNCYNIVHIEEEKAAADPIKKTGSF